MTERQKNRPIILFSDVPGDEQKVRAILADWGVAEDSIKHLLTEAHANRRAPSTTQRPINLRVRLHNNETRTGHD